MLIGGIFMTENMIKKEDVMKAYDKAIEKVTDFKNDVLFKYTFGKNNEESHKLAKIIISGVFRFKIKKLTILNPELIPERVNDRNMILDIRVVTESGKEINIEMQNSSLTQSERYRFQIYGGRMLSSQEKRGTKRYSNNNVHEVYQIILINDINKKHLRLIDRYKMKNDEDEYEDDTLLNRAYVYIPYINITAKSKKIEEFSDVEKAIYILANGVSDDIIKSEVGKLMNDKMEKFNQDEELQLMAFNRNLKKASIEADMQDMYDQGVIEGKLIMLQSLIMNKYGLDESKWLKTLDLKQLEKVTEEILKDITLDELKSKINE